jgi:hypothetical protein
MFPGMATTPAAAPQGTTVRLIHGAMVTGVILFALVAHFIMLPKAPTISPIPSILLSYLPAVSLAGCALALVLRRYVPRRASDESADRYWMRAMAPAMLVWSATEVVCIMNVVVYSQSGSPTAAVLGAIATALFVYLNPKTLQRR